MDTASLIALLMTGLSAGLSVMLLRLLVQERQRSEARVLALAALAAQPPATPLAYATSPALEPPPVKLRPRSQPPAPGAGRRESAPVEAEEFPLDREPTLLRVSHELPLSHGLFEPQARRRSPLLYIGVGAVAIAALVAFSLRWAGSSALAPTAETSGAIAAPVADPALALVALTHARQPDGSLMVTGVVRNPASSAPRERVTVAVTVVDSNGALIASARTPLDFTTLAPGEESPFVVRIEDAQRVARYRVGFRDAEGTVVAHIDRR